MLKRAGLLAILAGLLLALPAGTIQAEDQKTLTGEFEWNAGSQGELEAVFTPTGEGTWDVDFNFTFRGKPHTYSGTAEGSFDGKLEGEVRNDNKQRTFTFSGKFENGIFTGTHAETTGGKPRDTGTLSLGA